MKPAKGQPFNRVEGGDAGDGGGVVGRRNTEFLEPVLSVDTVQLGKAMVF